MVDFNKLADKKLDDVERPPLPPVGHYRFKNVKVPDWDPRPDGEWFIIEFTLQAQEAMDDVDPDDLAAFGKVSGITLRKSFMCSRDDEAEADKMLYNVKRFLIDHLQCADEGMSLKQGLGASVGAECQAAVVHKQDKNDEELFHANIGRTAPVE